MSDSRTKNSARNAIVSLGFHAAYTIASFVVRKLFISTLGDEYLSLNGLFTNILTVLSFAELGIGNAIIFNLYKPIANGDTEKIKSLMKLYQKAYTIIGFMVFGVGMALIPFLSYLVSGEVPNVKENVTFIYVLYIFDTAVSYFFSYKQAIITAYQKNYIVSAYRNSFRIGCLILKGVFLYTTHNFTGYVIIQIVTTILNNGTLSLKANKMFPFIKEKDYTPISKEERKSIFADVKALFMYKLGSTVLNGTDNIIITKVITFTSVGLVSNFNMIITAIAAVVDQLPHAVIASVGNLNASANSKKKNQVFDVLFFACVWLYGFCGSGVFYFANDFVSIVFGKDWVIDEIVIFSLALSFFVSSVSFPAYTYRTTLGYFVQGRFAPFAAAIINVLLSIFMGKWIGLSGIFFATSISRFLTMGLVDPILIYTRCFKKNPLIYYAKYFGYLAVVLVIAYISSFVISFVPLGGILGFGVKFVIYAVVFNALAFLASFKTKEFIYLKSAVIGKLVKKVR